MRVAVVTGMARTAGIGHAICTTLLDAGLAVIGLDHQPLESSSTLSDHPQFCSKVTSVTDPPTHIQKEISQALSELRQSQISVVVNNAGIAQPFLQSTTLLERIEEFDKYIAVNLRSAFVVTEVCRSYFPKNKGGVSIVHISSTRALQSPEPSSECPNGQAGYAAAKAGMIGLMHSQGQELKGQARVNVVFPGWIDTGDPTSDNYYQPTEQDHQWHAVGRVGKPSDVAELVAFLADDEKSGFITCQEFVIDGGVSRKMVYPE